MLLKILKYDIAGELLPLVGEKQPRAQKCRPQVRLRKSGNSNRNKMCHVNHFGMIVGHGLLHPAA